MKRLMIIVLFALVAWQGYGEYKSRRFADVDPQDDAKMAQTKDPAATQRETTTKSHFRCDGRTYCSQMTSCAEATFFLRNCPGVKMDGNYDGVPCEKQWCK
jgi:hypothetical protein